MAATERVPVMMTPAEKKRVVFKAKQAGLKTSEFMRRAAEGYQSEDDVSALGAMIEQMNKATENASKSIDDALAFIAKSNNRIRKMEDLAKRGTAQ